MGAVRYATRRDISSRLPISTYECFHSIRRKPSIFYLIAI